MQLGISCEQSRKRTIQLGSVHLAFSLEGKCLSNHTRTSYKIAVYVLNTSQVFFTIQ